MVAGGAIIPPVLTALRGTADHAADGFEAAHLNADIKMAAQCGRCIHGEGVDR